MNFQKSQDKSPKQKIDYSKIFSPSKLTMFFQCPKLYHFYYLDPIYSQMKNELKTLPHNIWSFHTLGKAVHNAITLFYYLPLGEKTQNRLLENLKQTWRSEVIWNKKPPLGKWGGFKSLEDERESYGQAIAMLKNFFAMAEINPQIKYLPTNDFRRSIEDYKNLISPLNGDFDISGKFDLIVVEPEGNLCIIDFKTGKNGATDPFQLRFYKALAEVKLQTTVKKTCFYQLRTGNKENFGLGDGDTEEIKKEILEKIIKIKSEKNFESKPSKLCKYCLFKTFCPAKEEVEKIIESVPVVEFPEDLPF